MLLLCLGTGVGVTDCHSQCTHWLRNDTGPCMGCGGTGDRKGRPYRGHGGAVGRRATARVAPTGENARSMPCDRSALMSRKGRPYGGECTPLKCLAEFAACERQNYARGRLGAFWRKNRRFFVRDDKRAVPEWDSPFESVKRVYCAALAALMDSISSGTTLNRSPTIP